MAKRNEGASERDGGKRGQWARVRVRGRKMATRLPQPRLGEKEGGWREGRRPSLDVPALIAARRQKFSRHLPVLPSTVDGDPPCPMPPIGRFLMLHVVGPSDRPTYWKKVDGDGGGPLIRSSHCLVWGSTPCTTAPCCPNGVRCCAGVERVFHLPQCAHRRGFKRNSMGIGAPQFTCSTASPMRY